MLCMLCALADLPAVTRSEWDSNNCLIQNQTSEWERVRKLFQFPPPLYILSLPRSQISLNCPVWCWPVWALVRSGDSCRAQTVAQLTTVDRHCTTGWVGMRKSEWWIEWNEWKKFRQQPYGNMVVVNLESLFWLTRGQNTQDCLNFRCTKFHFILLLEKIILLITFQDFSNFQINALNLIGQSSSLTNPISIWVGLHSTRCLLNLVSTNKTNLKA